MAVTRWTFYDAVANETYQFAVNPSEGGSPQNNKSISYQSTTAPNGKTIIFEGKDQPQTLEFSGTILTQAHYQTFLDWFQKRNQILVTDDLGRQMYIYITSFEPKRERAHSYPWKHSYSMKATILSWV